MNYYIVQYDYTLLSLIEHVIFFFPFALRYQQTSRIFIFFYYVPKLLIYVMCARRFMDDRLVCWLYTVFAVLFVLRMNYYYERAVARPRNIQMLLSIAKFTFGIYVFLCIAYTTIYIVHVLLLCRIQ